MSAEHEVIDQEEYDHVRIKNRMIEDYLALIGVHAFAVYAVLKVRANNTTGRCFPGLKHIERLTGLSRPTVIKAIRTLEEYQLIAVEHRQTTSGDNASNAYYLKTPPETPLKQDLRGSKGGLPPDKEVVNDVDYLVNEIDQGGKGDLPPVVNDVYPNKTHLFNKTQSNKTQQQQQQPPPKTTPTAQPSVVVVAPSAALVTDLVAQGVTRTVAERLLLTCGEEMCRKQLDALPLRKCEDAAATLVAAIREGWEVPQPKRQTPRPRLRVATPRATPTPSPGEAGKAGEAGTPGAAPAPPAPPGTPEPTEEQRDAARNALATARNAMRKR